MCVHINCESLGDLPELSSVLCMFCHGSYMLDAVAMNVLLNSAYVLLYMKMVSKCLLGLLVHLCCVQPWHFGDTCAFARATQRTHCMSKAGITACTCVCTCYQQHVPPVVQFLSEFYLSCACIAYSRRRHHCRCTTVMPNVALCVHAHACAYSSTQDCLDHFCV
jgi:hypothetical protein